MVDDMFNMLVNYDMKIPASDQVKLDDLNQARSGFTESMELAGEFVEAHKAEMMKSLKVGVTDLEEALFKIQTSLNDGVYVQADAEPGDVLDELAKVRKALDEHGACCALYKKYQALFGIPSAPSPTSNSPPTSTRASSTRGTRCIASASTANRGWKTRARRSISRQSITRWTTLSPARTRCSSSAATIRL